MCKSMQWHSWPAVIQLTGLITTSSPARSMSHALKTCNELKAEYMYVHVAAAAQWILQAGGWSWGQIRWGKTTILGRTKRSLAPAQWVTWMRGYANMKTSSEASRLWADVLARKMEGIILEHGYTMEIMIAGDSKQQTMHDSIWEESRYAHLLRFPTRSRSDFGAELRAGHCKRFCKGTLSLRGR